MMHLFRSHAHLEKALTAWSNLLPKPNSEVGLIRLCSVLVSTDQHFPMKSCFFGKLLTGSTRDLLEKVASATGSSALRSTGWF